VLFRSAGWQLAACGAMHVVNDALFAGLYPLLPLMAVDLGLTYAQVGLIKMAFSGSSSLFQVPAGMAAERFGEHGLLALGTAWSGLGLAGMALATGFGSLLAISVVAGVGGNAQHPVATSIVSRLFDDRRRGTAIGTLNFAGDIGKVLAPVAVGLVALGAGWRGAAVVMGAAGALFALLYGLAVPPPGRPGTATPPREGAAPLQSPAHGPPPPSGAPGAARGRWGIRQPGRFAALIAIGVLDSAARGASLTFIPFLLETKGLDAAAVSLAFAVLFGAGAAGKFICGPLADRYGNVVTVVVTELVTAAALLGCLAAPAGWVIAALVPLGFVLNGTSSVLYAAVAGLVDVGKRARGYGVYYTCSQLAAAVAPVLYGLLADRAGLPATFACMAAMTAAIAPLAIAGRGRVRG
jgi:FSR family fosmidomycin resistance protein-like MFS transporter